MFAEVIIDIKNKQINRSFDYIVPKHLEPLIKPGFRVIVPFGRLKRTGYVINIKENSDFEENAKEITDCLDVKPVLNEELIDIAKYIAENNFSYYSVALDAMIPRALKVKYQKIAVPYSKDNLEGEIKELFGRRKELVLDGLSNEALEIVYKNVENGLLYLDTKLKRKKDDNIIKMVHLISDEFNTRSKKKAAVIDYLVEADSDIPLDILKEDMGINMQILNELTSDGIISFYDKIDESIKEEINVSYDSSNELNDEQKNAFNSISYDEYKTYLLHGVTGSGKTLVYIKTINEVIKKGKNAIMLVPEISLTPQVTSILFGAFKDSIAILHSRLSTSERYQEWKKIISGEVRIVVGARSAIFAPLKNLGVIIVDEAHEGSYIQSNNPKYNAIEIAKKRAEKYNIPLILGTATPKVVDYYFATNGIYELLELKKRANNKPMPDVKIADLRAELKNGNKSVLSIILQDEIKKCYKEGNQSILFINRRGYSRFVMCRSCGTVIKCPHCDVALTYHERINSLVCHHCGYIQSNTTACPTCGSDKIRYVGSGTEKIVEQVQSLLPEAKILKVDQDSINKMEDYEDFYKAFKNHEADIIVGTQMITKGLDFKDVTLVGVINADLSLQYPVYDSNEVSFNLIEQVAGRCGRAEKPGLVVIQTYNPNHFVIQNCKNHDYDAYYKSEIKNRENTVMPPFSECIQIIIKSADKNLAKNEADIIKRNLVFVKKSSVILGPVEAYPFKKNDIYHYQIQVQAVEDQVLEKIRYLYPIYQDNKDISIEITRM